MELLKQFKEEFMKFEKERQELANAEKLFGIPITSYPVLMSMEQELKGLEQIFSIYERQKVTYPDFKEFFPHTFPGKAHARDEIQVPCFIIYLAVYSRGKPFT